MPSGSCLCGKVKISFDEGESDMKALCHCADCKKISGSTYSTNIVTDQKSFKTEGSPKTYEKTSDAGRSITSHFCGDCGSTLYRTGGAFTGKVIVKAGVLDDINVAHPAAELYSEARPSWVSKVDGTKDLNAMGGS